MTELVTPAAWLADALCGQVGGDEWYPEKGQTAASAKKVCASCPVTAACLQYAIDNEIQTGVWGGVTLTARRAVFVTTRECATPDCAVTFPRVGTKRFCGPCAQARYAARGRRPQNRRAA